MSAPSPARTAEAVQRAAGVIAARQRGDLDGAEALLAAFAGPADQARAFCLLAELALGLIRSQTGQTMDELVQELAMLIEQALGAPPPRPAGGT
ncbi:superoxide dismutase [Dactylosporangium sp. CA-092794]|uniref:superoxide dismutase n=1 Tax=Dactylosporangium sp. CA-092794 TaxID=3239929 RepID=UPI003D94DD6C